MRGSRSTTSNGENDWDIFISANLAWPQHIVKLILGGMAKRNVGTHT